eukprot:gene8939-10482_t
MDTLEAYGGIWNIPIGDKTLYPSELGNNGMVGWVTVQNTAPGAMGLDWSSTISWPFLQSVWGWNIWLWYGYAVGSFQVTQDAFYIISCTGTRTYFIKSQTSPFIDEFIGDFFSYGVGEQLVPLVTGNYQFIVRLDSSVRLNQSPLASFSCTLTPQWQNNASIIAGDTILPDIVDGKLVSPYASLTIINTNVVAALDNVSARVSLKIGAEEIEVTTKAVLSGLTVQPGQKVAVPIEIEFSQLIDAAACPVTATVQLYSNRVPILTGQLTFNCTSYPNPYLFTFLDYDNTVQYAITNPPSDCAGEPCGVMIATHGAGVEASTAFWMDAIPRQSRLWILYPTGRRSWGYDWESASRLNVFGALNYLSKNLPGLPTNLVPSFPIDASKVLFVGHSMGGHGCWSLLSHFGDLAVGGACAAGFVKLQFYVFMNTRPGFSYVDPVLQGILMASIAENDNDLYTTNLVGLPLMARYGQNDTNVNPWHSRRMARMVAEQSDNPAAVIISEVPNEGHWFDGILGDNYMQAYYDSIVSSGLQLPPLPKSITITTNNPSSSGTRANIQILQLSIPFRVGRIHIQQVQESSGLTWVLTTQNIRRFALSSLPARAELPTTLRIDGQTFPAQYAPFHYSSPDNKYAINWNCSDDNTWSTVERSPATYGPMRQIFEKPFTIVIGTNATQEEIDVFLWSATYISNFWSTYGRGSPQIVRDVEFVSTGCSAATNYILIGSTEQNLLASKWALQLPVEFYGPTFSIGSTTYADPDMGTAFLAPNECGAGLLLVVAGNSVTGLLKAVKTIPQRSGVVAPDFVVVGSEWGWKGAGGIVATGFWDNNWLLQTDSSYLGLNVNSLWN